MEHENEGGVSSDVESRKLARFLTPPPPRSKSSMPPPPEPATLADVEGTSPSEPETTPQRISLFADLMVPRSARHSTPIGPPDPEETPSSPELEPASVDDAETSGERDRRASAGDELAAPLPPRDRSTPDHDPEVDDDDDLSILPGIGSSWGAHPVVRRGVVVAAVAAVVALLFLLRVRRAPTPLPLAEPPHEPTSAVPPIGEPTAPPAGDMARDAVPPAASAEDKLRGETLKREARALLESGQALQGVAKARLAVAANSADPEVYILLAAGLQDLGRWQESQEIFRRCVHQAGVPKAECIYFATREK